LADVYAIELLHISSPVFLSNIFLLFLCNFVTILMHPAALNREPLANKLFLFFAFANISKITLADKWQINNEELPGRITNTKTRPEY
jgi:hypothetical protein